MTNVRNALLLSALLFSASHLAAGTGRIIIVNVDGPGIGFNDPKPVTPVGGNDGLTIGRQRLNVYERAAERWRTTIDTNVDIRIRSSFPTLTCADGGVVLGDASILSWSRDFEGAPQRGIQYPSALANKFAGLDLKPLEDDMAIRFNAAVDNPDCLGDRSWYYGFDGNEGADDALYTVVLHEIAHGLGFAGKGAENSGPPTVYDTHTFDLSAGLRWDQMTFEQKEISKTNTGNLVWDGPNVTAAAPRALEPIAYLTVTEPAAVAKNYEIGTAAFGPSATRSGLTGRAVLALDAANADGPSVSDGCSALTNADAISGNIAVIDRGTCTFVRKVRNAQAAGATGVIVADNRRTTCTPPALGGSDAEVTIPAISVTQDDGTALKSQLSIDNGVRGMLRLDPSRLAGTVQQGFVRLYAPCEFAGGSSIHHFDTSASPNLLMEPFISSDLPDAVDLTIHQLMDIGWSQPPRSGRRFVRR